MHDNRHFYRDLKQLESFSEAVEAKLHQALPDDWWIVVADVADYHPLRSRLMRLTLNPKLLSHV